MAGINIYDIAAKSGVSIATVSRVMNNSPNVRPQTREKVMRVMQEEGFLPNSLARGLSLGSTHTAAILCTDVRDPFYAQAVGDIEEHLRTHGFNVILRCTGNALPEKRQALNFVIRQHVDVILLVGSAFCEAEDNSHIAAIAARAPIILLNGYLDIPGVYCVSSDERSAVREVTLCLIREGHRRVLLLHDTVTYSCRQKLAGYRDAYIIAGQTADETLIYPVSNDPDTVTAAVTALLTEGAVFDAVIAVKDEQAIGAQKALAAAGRTVPVIGFNNSLPSRCTTPTLTSIDNALPQMCRTALHMLDDLLEKKKVTTHAIIPARLVERESYHRKKGEDTL